MGQQDQTPYQDVVLADNTQYMYEEQQETQQLQQQQAPVYQDQQVPARNQKSILSRIQSRSDTVPAQSRFASIVSKISEFINALFNSEGTARNDRPGLAAILSVSSLIVASILYI